MVQWGQECTGPLYMSSVAVGALILTGHGLETPCGWLQHAGKHAAVEHVHVAGSSLHAKAAAAAIPAHYLPSQTLPRQPGEASLFFSDLVCACAENLCADRVHRHLHHLLLCPRLHPRQAQVPPASPKSEAVQPQRGHTWVTLGSHWWHGESSRRACAGNESSC
jgi:hypothetical protein